MQQQGGSPPPGWHPDPQVPGQLRWWDGSAWSDQTAPAAGQSAAQPAYAAGGGYAAAGGPAPSIDTWLWQSILATLLCCLPLGIVAIVFSSQAQSAMNTGNYALAADKAKQAKNFTLISVGLGVLAVVLYIVFVVVIGASVGFSEF